ncbi:PAS domain-containing protein [Sphingomonas mollis]|uniref:histidine kinase n=1 Tax=Sphingomonas mollis TaxID=2795726 RepID=A0ABS0XTI4_9SPHN|nr:PAS domain-containing protein [Sphingomonas sp. BT553]MBJ6123359.1 PAS domain-containing protein [Sphingomonas sp. BT553]
MINEQEQSRIEHELVRKDRGTDPFSAAVRATRMPMVITDPNQDDNPIVFVNGAFSKLTGFAENEILGRNCRFLQGPDTDREDVARLRDAITRRRSIELELLNYRKDGTTFWNRVLVSPVFDEEGHVTYFFASQFDVTMERERLVNLQRDRDDLEAEIGQRTSDLVQAESRLRFALEAAQLGSWSIDLATERMTVTDGCKENWGRSLAEPFLYSDIKSAVHPDDRAHRDEALRIALEETGDYDVEYRIHTPTGEERWLAVRGQVFRRADGSPLLLVGVSQNITGRKRAEEHRSMLAHELNHRVKNMLATLQAIVGQTLRNATSLESAADTLAGRIQAMDAANDLLVNDRWERAAMATLVDRSLAPFRTDDGDRIRAEGPDVHIPPRIAVGLSLALHELGTNAAKYGALSTPQGHVAVCWRIEDGVEPVRLHISWEETGGPAVTTPTRTGFGSKLIQRVLASEIGGTAHIEYRPTGVVFTAVAPLPEPEDSDAG